ncbi:helix-turn-helix domain-containing protein [Actinomadura violacea]|uniref:Helix-turn-helix domain-containing protein n=1 Tax=Actinomadura violacea TaxID=2819934 RepID=A0ABS3RV19_9ACTN|nr:helix-turn-helix domain-containing protein [Actinomadura violacea]MBO2459865.1 helix-turn-helix domain-containing protein [Actinomadura violacea]
MTRNDWPSALATSIAEQVRRYRKDRGLSAQQLADACTALGMETSRSAIANFESGRRPTISVAELLIFAHALRVPPLLLVVPVGADQSVQLAPGVATSAWDAAQWFAGLGRDAGDNPIRLFQRHDRFVSEYEFAARRSAGARSMLQDADGDRREAHAATAHAADQAARLAEEVIDEIRDDIRALGLTPPALPAELAHLP